MVLFVLEGKRFQMTDVFFRHPKRVNQQSDEKDKKDHQRNHRKNSDSIDRGEIINEFHITDLRFVGLPFFLP
jgi:hypothetical protein